MTDYLTKEMRLTISSLVYEGFGLGRLPDGRALFVPFVLPGEEVIARVIEEKRGYGRGELVSIITPHPRRAQPRCLHFGMCGGCHYQHIPYDLQQSYKMEIFKEQLQRIAGLDNPMVTAILPSGQEYQYRNSLQFGLNGQGHLCFMDFYNHKPFQVSECHLPMAEIGQVWPLVEFEGGVDIQRVEYRQNETGELLMVLQGGAQALPQLASEASLSIVHLNQADEVVVAGDGYLVIRVNGRPFKVSAASFFQTNFSTAAILARELVAFIQQEQIHTVLDVYCGVGFFSAFLAPHVESIAGIEASPSACEDFIENLDDFEHVALFQGKAEFILPNMKEHFDAILVDPPRGGLKKEVTQSLMSMNPSVILYISCNPATLARDVKHLAAGGYRLEASTIVDMFPQTFHMESINVFKK